MVSNISLMAPVEVRKWILASPRHISQCAFFWFSRDGWADGVHSVRMLAGIDTYFSG